MLNLFQHEFVQNAFLAGTLVAIVSAMVGYFVVLRGQAFAGETLSHIGFTGATGAALLGIPSLLGVFILTILAAFTMGALGKRLRGRDIEIGMVLSFMLGLGVLFLSLYTQHATETVNILFGSILSITHATVAITLGVVIGTISLLAFLFRPLLFASIDPAVAEARGIPVQGISVVFLFLMAVTVSEAVLVVGVLLVFALLVVPAASAEQITRRPLATLCLAVAISLVSTWGGLVLAFIGHWPVSFYIVALTSFFYFVSRLINHLSNPRHYRQPPHPDKEVAGPSAD
jgi:zinc/manganese transport system permease protein